MVRPLSIIVVLLAAILPTGSSAAVSSYAAVNLHNGFIEVRSYVTVDNKGTDVTATTPLLATLRRSDGTFQESANVFAGTPIYLNDCCIVAGSLYEVQVKGVGHSVTFKVRPKLCNVRGIPFGYEIVTISGRAERDSNNNYKLDLEPRVLEAPCPTT